MQQNELDELFFSSSVEEIKQGYIFNQEKGVYHCLQCGTAFEDGFIYESGTRLMEAKRAITEHIKSDHPAVFEALLNMDKKYTGLTEHQKELLSLFYEGVKDKEIVERTSSSSTSTVRNVRFVLKEKEKQAKVFLSIMELLNEKKQKGNDNIRTNTYSEELVPIHKGATMVDERYSITEKERAEAIKTYFEGESLRSFPAREKKKIIVLHEIQKHFEQDRKYTEKEVNEILKSIFPDFATLRRYLIEYGFMTRTLDCSEYWIQ